MSKVIFLFLADVRVDTPALSASLATDSSADLALLFLLVWLLLLFWRFRLVFDSSPTDLLSGEDFCALEMSDTDKLWLLWIDSGEKGVAASAANWPPDETVMLEILDTKLLSREVALEDPDEIEESSEVLAEDPVEADKVVWPPLEFETMEPVIEVRVDASVSPCNLTR